MEIFLTLWYYSKSLFVLKSGHSMMSDRAEYKHQSRTNKLRRILDTRSASHAKACRKFLIHTYNNRVFNIAVFASKLPVFILKKLYYNCVN